MLYQIENFGGEQDYRSRIHYGFDVSVHIHEYSEFVFCKKGVAEATINDKIFHIPQNHIVFIGPNQPHGYNCTEDSLVYCAVFSNDLIPHFFKQLKNKTIVPTLIDVSESLLLAEMLPKLNCETPTLISGCLNFLCDIVLKTSPLTENTSKDDALYQRVISYLSTHYSENITLKNLATEFGYSEKYLSGMLHSLTGINFRKLLAFYRIEHAKHMLESRKKYSMTDIAMQCGFSSISTFNMVFKQITGVTPSQYSKRQIGER